MSQKPLEESLNAQGKVFEWQSRKSRVLLTKIPLFSGLTRTQHWSCFSEIGECSALEHIDENPNRAWVISRENLLSNWLNSETHLVRHQSRVFPGKSLVDEALKQSKFPSVKAPVIINRKLSIALIDETQTRRVRWKSKSNRKKPQHWSPKNKTFPPATCQPLGNFSILFDISLEEQTAERESEQAAEL
jgi:hypothetical protein